jgi:hypothetical protein
VRDPHRGFNFVEAEKSRCCGIGYQLNGIVFGIGNLGLITFGLS